MSESFSILHAGHLEAPVRSFWVRYHHQAHRPDGWPWVMPAHKALLDYSRAAHTVTFSYVSSALPPPGA